MNQLPRKSCFIYPLNPEISSLGNYVYVFFQPPWQWMSWYQQRHKEVSCVLFDKDKPHIAVCSAVRALQDFDSEVLVSANSGCAETVSVLLVKTVRGKYSIYILYSISHFAIVAHSTRSWKSLWAKWMAVSGVIFLTQEINMKFADGMRCPRSKKEHKIKSRFKNDPFCLCRIFITLSLSLGK